MRQKIFRRNDSKTLCRIQTDTWVTEAYWLRSAIQTDQLIQYCDANGLYYTFGNSYISYNGSEPKSSLSDSDWEINPICKI